MDVAMSDFSEALEFTHKTHSADLERIDSLDHLVTNFDSFFYEYVYVVVASGFKGKIAAKITPILVDCRGNEIKMFEHFKNKRKIKAISNVWQMKNNWSTLRESLTSVDALTKFPFIGEVTKFHLARNIGLLSCVKPDLHLCRWCKSITGNEAEEATIELVSHIAERVGRKKGTVDFALWVWLSHSKGTEKDCCYGGYALR